ncbi:MAG: hypothetical protein ACI86M_001368 [Saprospiraceae bacterium]|jgi:hypothetical protein
MSVICFYAECKKKVAGGRLINNLNLYIPNLASVILLYLHHGSNTSLQRNT